ncbi:hypothetical protein CYMTET_7040, partial [Cymbomonas tetramitiformis]
MVQSIVYKLNLHKVYQRFLREQSISMADIQISDIERWKEMLRTRDSFNQLMASIHIAWICWGCITAAFVRWHYPWIHELFNEQSVKYWEPVLQMMRNSHVYII